MNKIGNENVYVYEQVEFEEVSNPLLPLSNHGPHMCADPGAFHTTGTGESERPIGFAPEVMNGTTENEVPSAPLPSCPVEDSPPRHDTTLESSFSDHPCNNDIDPPSYEEVVSNETYYEQPSEPSEP
uniref:Uncharacterized protein n=1 Tax=Phlebotomus papatasi TaxID=29031 RepID=A0A1B0D2J9_PHLPP